MLALTPTRRALKSLVAPLVLAGALVAATEGGSSAAPPAPCAWRVQPSPNVGSSTLAGVSATSATNAWAVGYSKVSEVTSPQTLIEHWNGLAWIVHPSPNAGSGPNFLLSVAATSATNAWAVGDYSNGTSLPPRTLVEHWNGEVWEIQPSPNPGTDSNEFLGLAALSATGAWAVGFYSNGSALRTLIEHWNGRAWTVQRSPNVGSGSNILYSVTATSATNAWAMGYYFDGNTYRTLIEHWNGRAWTVQRSPNVGIWANVLYGGAATSTINAWAMSHYYNSTLGADQTLIEHWNGTAWKVQPSPNPGTHNSYLQGVVATSATNAWTVGYYFDSRYRTLIEHWNGKAWTIIPSPNVGNENNALFGMASVSPINIWAVGEIFNGPENQTLILHWC